MRGQHLRHWTKSSTRLWFLRGKSEASPMFHTGFFHDDTSLANLYEWGTQVESEEWQSLIWGRRDWSWGCWGGWDLWDTIPREWSWADGMDVHQQVCSLISLAETVLLLHGAKLPMTWWWWLCVWELSRRGVRQSWDTLEFQPNQREETTLSSFSIQRRF